MGTNKFTINYLSQRDVRWTDMYFGNWNMKDSGCYQTVFAMAINALRNTTYTPAQVAAWSYQYTQSFNRTDQGTKGDEIPLIAKHYGVKYKVLTSLAEINDSLSKGHIVVGAEGPGKFTIEGYTHAILLNGYLNGYTTAYDPYNEQNNGGISTKSIWKQRGYDPLDYYNNGCFFALYI